MLKITIIAMGHKLPGWVQSGVEEYQKRLQDKFNLSLIEVPMIHRTKSSDLSRLLDKEKAAMSLWIPPHAYGIALEIKGRTFSSEQLAVHMDRLQHQASHLYFLIGGPEGLPKALSTACQEQWSLSSLTMPHTLARIHLLETLYRVWTMNHHHPYHKS